MVLEETKAAGPEDDGDTEEEEEEDNPQDDDSVGHRKLVIVDQLPTPPQDSRAQGEIERRLREEPACAGHPGLASDSRNVSGPLSECCMCVRLSLWQAGSCRCRCG